MSDHKPKPVSVIMEHLEDGSTVALFKGVLTKLFPAKQSKPDDQKQWCIQNGELKDAAGDCIQVMFKDRDPMDVNAWKGKTITLECKDGDKGLCGVYVFDDEYNGTKTRKLKVTKTGIIMREGETAGEQRAPATQQQAPRRETTQQMHAGGGKDSARHVIAKVAALHNVCIDAAVATAAALNERHGYMVVPTTVMIWADKYLMEAIRRTSFDDLPFNPYAAKPFNGKRLADLLPTLTKQIADTKQQQAEEAAEKRQPENHPATYEEGLEDDDIPF